MGTGAATHMDDGATALRNRARPRPNGGLPRADRRVLQPHHRRRRALALAVLAGLALIAGVVVGAGGGNDRSPSARPGARVLLAAADARRDRSGIVRRHRESERERGDRPHARLHAVCSARRVPAQGDRADLRRRPRPVHAAGRVAARSRRTLPATFFEVGVVEHDFHSATSLIVADGYPIGDHTENHAAMSQLSPRRSADPAAAADRERPAATAPPFPRLFRPPYGLWDNDTLALLHKYRMLMVLWTVDTSDYREPGRARDRALGGLRCAAGRDHPDARRRR